MLLKVDCLPDAVGKQPSIPLIYLERKWTLNWWWWWWWWLGHDSHIDHQIGARFTYWSSDWGMIHILIIRLGHDSHIDHQIGARFTYWSSDWGTIHILIIRLGHDSHIDRQFGARFILFVIAGMLQAWTDGCCRSEDIGINRKFVDEFSKLRLVWVSFHNQTTRP